MIQKKIEKEIIRLKSGNYNSFDFIYEHTSQTVYFTILYIVKDKMVAEDILQDTYIRAISVISQYKEGTNFIGWLCSIGKSLALNHLKKYRRETVGFDEESYRTSTNESEFPYIIDIASRILTAEEYKIVMLCQVSGYKRREVSHMLKIPIGTVTWRNNIALKKLKNYLFKEDAQ